MKQSMRDPLHYDILLILTKLYWKCIDKWRLLIYFIYIPWPFSRTVLRKFLKRICMNVAVCVAKSYPWGELEKTGTSIKTGTAAAPGACPTFPGLAFRRGKMKKKKRKEKTLPPRNYSRGRNSSRTNYHSINV